MDYLVCRKFPTLTLSQPAWTYCSPIHHMDINCCPEMIFICTLHSVFSVSRRNQSGEVDMLALKDADEAAHLISLSGLAQMICLKFVSIMISQPGSRENYARGRGRKFFEPIVMQCG
jgi:hypothetical protein